MRGRLPTTASGNRISRFVASSTFGEANNEILAIGLAVVANLDVDDSWHQHMLPLPKAANGRSAHLAPSRQEDSHGQCRQNRDCRPCPDWPLKIGIAELSESEDHRSQDDDSGDHGKANGRSCGARQQLVVSECGRVDGLVSPKAYPCVDGDCKRQGCNGDEWRHVQQLTASLRALVCRLLARRQRLLSGIESAHSDSRFWS